MLSKMRKSTSELFSCIFEVLPRAQHSQKERFGFAKSVYTDRLVLDNLKLLPHDRKCFRMINGVLIEKSIKDVLPALQTNSQGLKKVLDELLKQYKRQQDEMESWKVSKYITLGAYGGENECQDASCDNSVLPEEE